MNEHSSATDYSEIEQNRITGNVQVVTQARHLPGEVGIWVLIFGDLVAFAVLFIIFMYYKGANPLVFSQAHEQMNQVFGAVNTFLLLTSSWFVATGVQAARHKLASLATRCFNGAFFCGAAFAIVKYFEYSEKIAAGLTIKTNSFFHAYYMFTSIHLLHVTLGMVVLYLMAKVARSGKIAPRDIRFMETGASFWHMVDLLWIVLFALFYLVN